MPNTNLANTKTAKNDGNFTEFFAQNFELLGLKKLISTSYAPEGKKYKMPYQPMLFETQQPYFDNDKSKTHGKIFVLGGDVSHVVTGKMATL